MKDIALYKTIFINVDEGIHLQEYIINGKAADLYKLDMTDFDIFQFSKFMDGDLLTLQLQPEFLDDLCEAWLVHRQKKKKRQHEEKTDTTE